MSASHHFGKIVRDAREQKTLTIFQLSEMCNISDRCLENIELGDSDPKLSTVIRIAKALCLDLGLLNNLNERN
jgi:ribosome-binding protein aMBF1 (putative translation factor)